MVGALRLAIFLMIATPCLARRDQVSVMSLSTSDFGLRSASAGEEGGEDAKSSDAGLSDGVEKFEVASHAAENSSGVEKIDETSHTAENSNGTFAGVRISLFEEDVDRVALATAELNATKHNELNTTKNLGVTMYNSPKEAEDAVEDIMDTWGFDWGNKLFPYWKAKSKMKPCMNNDVPACEAQMESWKLLQVYIKNSCDKYPAAIFTEGGENCVVAQFFQHSPNVHLQHLLGNPDKNVCSQATGASAMQYFRGTLCWNLELDAENPALAQKFYERIGCQCQYGAGLPKCFCANTCR